MLVKTSSPAFEHVDELFSCGTDPFETVANDSGIVRFPGGQVERRPTGIQTTVSPDDIRDRLGLDFAFRSLSATVDVEVKQGMGVFVDQCPRKIGIVLPITHLGTRLYIDEPQLLADILRLTVRPLHFRNDPNRHAKFVSGSSYSIR